MSRSEVVSLPEDDKLLAFDYVSGVLRGKEREQFLQRFRANEQLQTEVAFWEEQLFSLDEQALRVPDPEVWPGIEARIQQQHQRVVETPSRRFAWLWPVISACASVMLVVCVGLLLARDPAAKLNADYVAVLTDTLGTPQLTVLTATGGEKLWLKWEAVAVPANKNIQLWAISKRDGQTRPLGVFAQAGSVELPLSEATWRLIKDASHLMLTEEDVGGSPLDEPSEIILAKGACVLLARINKTI